MQQLSLGERLAAEIRRAEAAQATARDLVDVAAEVVRRLRHARCRGTVQATGGADGDTAVEAVDTGNHPVEVVEVDRFGDVGVDVGGEAGQDVSLVK